MGHYDLQDLPPARSAEVGPMLQRVERALMGLGGIARVHVDKWGDGGAHLHLWLIARPAGMMQLRGTCLPIWDDLLPPQAEEQWRASWPRSLPPSRPTGVRRTSSAGPPGGSGHPVSAIAARLPS